MPAYQTAMQYAVPSCLLLGAICGGACVCLKAQLWQLLEYIAGWIHIGMRQASSTRLLVLERQHNLRSVGPHHTSMGFQAIAA